MTFSHLHTILQIVPFHTGQQISLTCCEIPWSLPPGSSSFSLLEGVLCYWLSLAAGPLGTSPLAPQENRAVGLEPGAAERSERFVCYCHPSALDVGLERSRSLELQIV